MTTYLDIETTSLEADRGKIAAIGLLKDEKPDVKSILTQEDEREALEWMNSRVKGEEIVTWYGSEFDIPFVLTRAAYLNVDLKSLIKAPKIDLFRHCREAFRLKSYSLRSVANFFGIRVKERFTGKDTPTLYKLVEGGDKEAQRIITQHCENDLQLLKRLHEWVKPYFKNTRRD